MTDFSKQQKLRHECQQVASWLVVCHSTSERTKKKLKKNQSGKKAEELDTQLLPCKLGEILVPDGEKMRKMQITCSFCSIFVLVVGSCVPRVDWFTGS